MSNEREAQRPRWGRYLVLAMVVADCLGIYVAQMRLNQPWAEPPKEPSGDAFAERDVVPAAVPVTAVPQPNFAMAEPPPAATPRGPDIVAELPAFMPLPPVAKEAPAVVPTVEVATPKPVFRSNRVAKLERTRMASSRFVSAFATDIVGPGSLESASPGAIPEAVQSGAPEAGSETGAAEAPLQDQVEAPAPVVPEVAAPDVDAELPAADSSAGAELPAS